ncbi:MAG: hypothetical protein E7599_02515 [Ruminococcaceae bacterium]|nr:hypothetical protein [Oscillospiraceae bacterium]
MFGFGNKNKKSTSANTNSKNALGKVQTASKKQSAPSGAPPRQSSRPSVPLSAANSQSKRPVRTPNVPRSTNAVSGNRSVSQQHPASQGNMQRMRQGTAQSVKKPTQNTERKKKAPSGPVITVEGLKQLGFVLIAAILLSFLLLSMLNGILYAINHLSFEFGYDVTVKLENGNDKPQKYICDNDSVFRDRSGEAYISLTRLSNSLSLSTVGNGERVKFYKTNALNNYVSLEHGSRHVIINGESICLSSPIYISGSQVYVPISFFERYTSSIIVNYNSKNHVMTVEYEINEALSTPKRKVLEEFRFVVCAPVGVVEMTEEERNEYAGLSKG